MPFLRLLLVLLCLASAPILARDYMVVSGGQSDFVIVLSADPSPSESLAAEELAHYIERMSGVRLPLRRGGPLPEKGLVLAVSTSPGRGPSRRRRSGEEQYALIPDGGRILLQASRGRTLLNAAYDLLDRLGCRFLAPELGFYQGAGEVIPGRDTLTLTIDRPVVVRPALAFRKLYVEEGLSHDGENLLRIIAWMPKAGYNTLVVPTDYQGTGRVQWDRWRERAAPELKRRDLTLEVGGHGYQNFLNAKMEEGKLFERHPEWFGQDAQGRRRKGKEWVFCTSNREAVDYLAFNVASYVKQRPEIDIFDFWPPDGADWCECPECVKLGSPTERQVLLVKQVTPVIRRVRPDLRLEVLAYTTSITPPEGAMLDREVLLDFCPISQNFWTQIYDPASTTNAHYMNGLRGWREKFDGDISIYSYYRKYAWDSLPVIFPGYMQKDLQFYLTIPVQGISTYAEPGDWASYELNHYALAELAKNPAGDVEALVEKFTKARYGPLARQAARALLAMGEELRRYGSLPGTRLQGAEETAAAAGRVDRALEEVRRAAAAAETMEQDAALSRSLTRLLLTGEYARRDLELRRLQALGDEAALREKARLLYEFLRQHAEDGVFLAGRISLNRVLANYGIESKKSDAGPGAE